MRTLRNRSFSEFFLRKSKESLRFLIRRMPFLTLNRVRRNVDIRAVKVELARARSFFFMDLFSNGRYRKHY
jgi:hypothetical protein